MWKPERRFLFIGLCFAVIVIALFFRLPDLAQRPMHGDEAINAVKFAELLETGKYNYNPQEYHGPALYYFTLPISWLSGQTNFQELNEITLRLVSILGGIGLILLLLLTHKQFNLHGIYSAMLLAVSPAFVFYSRYYIHEMLFVFFCFAFIIFFYRHWTKKTKLFLYLAAISAALMIATKETWVIPLFAAGVVLLWFGVANRQKSRQRIPLKQLVLAGVIFMLTLIVMYSSFFSNWQGIAAFFNSSSVYFDRAGNNPDHIHPWYQYLKWLIFFPGSGTGVWTEGLILVLSVFGIAIVFGKNRNLAIDYGFAQFMALFSVMTLIIFSAIPYKTPWNALLFWFGFIYIAGIGAAFIFEHISKKNMCLVLTIATVISFLQLSWQSYQLNFDKYSSTENPYVYAHPTEDVFLMLEQLDQIAKKHPDGYKVHIDIITEGDDYWPLPWYLRKFERIGWWDSVDMDSKAAPVTVISPQLEGELISKLYELPPPGQRSLYLPLFDSYLELRPGVELRGYIRKDVWDILNR